MTTRPVKPSNAGHKTHTGCTADTRPETGVRKVPAGARGHSPQAAFISVSKNTRLGKVLSRSPHQRFRARPARGRKQPRVATRARPAGRQGDAQGTPGRAGRLTSVDPGPGAAEPRPSGLDPARRAACLRGGPCHSVGPVGSRSRGRVRARPRRGGPRDCQRPRPPGRPGRLTWCIRAALWQASRRCGGRMW